jgi:CheY-like chemotaxis protein
MPSAPRSRAKVLVVEDDAISRELLAPLLQAGGFDVIAASTGEQALLALCQQRGEIDWLVSKVSLPGLVCGWILMDEYHEHHPGRPALLVSHMIDTAERPSMQAIFVPPAAPMRVLEVLKTLRTPEQDHEVPFHVSQAA